MIKLSLRLANIPVNKVVGHKDNKKIWSGTPPMHKFIYINSKYAPFYDPHIEDMKQQLSKKTIEKWGKIFGITDERKVAATLRKTTERILMCESDFPKNFAHSLYIGLMPLFSVSCEYFNINYILLKVLLAQLASRFNLK